MFRFDERCFIVSYTMLWKITKLKIMEAEGLVQYIGVIDRKIIPVIWSIDV